LKKIFLDTNVILDLLDSDRIHHLATLKVIEKAILDNYQIVISEDMLTTIFYIVKNKVATLDFFGAIINEWEIASFGKKIIQEAITICKENSGVDFEDLLQCLCAKEHKCECLITNDKKFYNCGIQVVASIDF